MESRRPVRRKYAGDESVADGFPFDLTACLRSSVEGCFGVRELLAELHELGAIHQLPGAREHLRLFFFRVEIRLSRQGREAALPALTILPARISRLRP